MDIEVINIIKDLIKQKYNGSIVYGSNTPDEGIGIRWRTSPQMTFLGLKTYEQMTLLLNGKSDDQLKICKILNEIHHYLTRLETYPKNDNVQICSIETSSGPELLGREENSQWLYGSSLTIKFYSRGE